MTLTFFTISYITLNILTAGISAVGIYLKWSHRTAIFDRISIYVLGMTGLYSVGYVLLWYMAPLEEYYALAFPFCLLLGPIFYFLILGRQEKKLMKTDFFHALPFVLSLPLYAVFVTDNNFRYQYHDLYYGFLHFFAFVSILSYSSWSFLLWSEIIQVRPSSLFLREGLVLTLFLLICGGLVLTASILWKGSFYVDLHGFAHTCFYLIELFLVWRLGIYMYTGTTTTMKPKLYRPIARRRLIEEVEEDSLDNGITTEQKQAYERSIELFIRKKGFADPSLTRDKFIEKTKIPSRHLGPFLQSCYGKGFSAFVNKLRVDYAAEELSKSDFEDRIDDLGLACGFRSRASFYRNFTAEFGCSPLEYRTTNLVMS